MKHFSADLPERHSVCHTLSHSSPLHRMFGFAMPMFRTDKRSAFMNHWFHSCPHCFQRRASLFILASHHDLKETDVSVSKTWTTCPNKRCSDCNKENANFVKTPDTWPKKLHKDSPPLPTQRPVGPDVETMGGHNFTLRDHRKAMLAAQFNHSKKEWTDDEFNTCMQNCLVNDVDKKKLRESTLEEPALPSILKEDSELSEDVFVESSLHHLFEGIHETMIIKMFPPVLTKLKVMMPVCFPWNKFLIKAKLSKASWMNLFCFAESGDGKSSPKTHSCAGWIGVNHLSCARLLKAGFSHVCSHLFPTDEDAEDVDVAKSHILDLMEANIQTHHSMVSRLMQKTT